MSGNRELWAAYCEGYQAALVPPPYQPSNPYPEGSEASQQWSDGYSDSTEDYIVWKYLPASPAEDQ